jgi:transposase-like protein
MDSPKKRFTSKDKREILAKADNAGTNAVVQEYGISQDLFSNWRKRFAQNQANSRIANKLKRLMKENEKLKKIVSDLTLELDWRD